jgi:hypothetical protein
MRTIGGEAFAEVGDLSTDDRAKRRRRDRLGRLTAQLTDAIQ